MCAIACGSVKAKLGYDDSLDAFGVHGVGGTLGAVLTGLFATRECWDIAGDTKLGFLEGGKIMGGQVAAVGVTWIFSIVATVVILFLLNAIVGLRVSKADETLGLDQSDHGEEGYIFT